MNINIKRDDALLVVSLMALLLPFYTSLPYLDDMVRLTYNYTGLIVQGRYLTEWFYTAMQGMKYTTFPDIYHFNLAYIVLAMLMVKKFALERNINTKDVGLPLILCIFSSPFILENISYHIDSLGMFSSLAFSIAAASLSLRRQIITIICSSALLFIATCFYQFSLNVYICTVSLMALLMSKRDSESGLITFAAVKVVSLFVSLAVYMIILRNYATDTYIDSHASFMSYDDFKAGTLLFNIGNVNSIIEAAFTNYYKIPFFILLSMAIIGFIFALYTNLKSRRIISAACVLISPLICFLMIYMPAVLFSKPIVQPRILIAYGFFLCAMIYFAFQVDAFKKASIVLLSVLFAVNVMTASAFNKSQEFVIHSTKDVMEKLYYSTPAKFRAPNGELPVTLTNRYNHGMEFERNGKYFPILNYLVRDPQVSPFLINGINRYYRTGVKVERATYSKDCAQIGMASPWISLSSCDDSSVTVTFINHY